MTIDEVIRAANPRARARWAGAPGGGPGAALLSVAVFAAILAAHLALVPRLAVLRPVLVITALGLPGYVAILVVGILSAAHDRRRTAYRVTTEGVFVGRGGAVVRWALPPHLPEVGGDLRFGGLAWEALAPDGRPWSRGTGELVLESVGARAAAVRAALAECGVAGDAPAAPAWTSRDVVRLAPLLVLAVGFGVVFGPPLAIAGTVLLVSPLAGVGWWLGDLVGSARRARARLAARAPVDATAFGVAPALVDEVRSWLARTRGLPADRLAPDDALAALPSCGGPGIFDDAGMTDTLLASLQPRAATVLDLVRAFDAALAAGPRDAAELERLG